MTVVLRHRASKNGRGLQDGLTGPQRRAVNRQLRLGRPSDDPLLREIQQQLADGMRSRLIAALCLLPCVGGLVVSGVDATSGFPAGMAAAAFLGVVWLYTLSLWRGMRAFRR